MPLKNIEDLTQEVEILRKVKHRNTVKLYNVVQTKTSIYLFMEFCSEGDLKSFIKSRSNTGTLGEIEARYVIREVVEGLNYLSRNCIMHRDIKLDNILVNREKAGH